MKALKENSWFILLLLIIPVYVFLWIKLGPDNKPDKKVEEIKELRQLILKMDSVNQVRQKQFVDSMKVEIGKDKGEIQAIKAINSKLQKLNEKTDRIYSAISVDMPDL